MNEEKKPVSEETDKKKKSTKEIVLYIIFGVLTTLVNFLVYTPLTKTLGADRPISVFGLFTLPWYQIANVIAWVAAVLFAFFTNKFFVFESKSFQPKDVFPELFSFAGARVLTLLIENGIMYLFIDLIHADKWGIVVWGAGLFGQNGDFAIKAGAEVIVIILNYIFSKLFIFKKKKE